MNKIFEVETASYKTKRVKLTDGVKSEWVDIASDLNLKDLRFGKKYEFEFSRSLIEQKLQISGFKEVVK